MRIQQIIRHPYFKISLAVLYVAILVILSINRSKKMSIDSDYYVFWNAGEEFASGGDLYMTEEGARAYIYPPFAAFVFQTLSVFPLKISANIFFLLNALVLLPLAVLLMLKICKNLGFDLNRIRLPVYLAALFSLKYFWNNLTMFQVNFLVFFVCLLGILYLAKAKPALAAIFFTVATFIKVYPLFLLLFTLLYFPKWKVWAYAVASGIGCLFVPSLFRGFSTSLQDHLSYYDTFLRTMQEGLVITSHTNHTIKAFIFKIMHPEVWNASVYASNYPAASLISNLLLLLLFVSLLAVSIYQYRQYRMLSLALLSCIFIFTHMISGITWTAHLVTSMLFYLPLFLIDASKLPNKFLRGFHFVLIALAVFLGIEGKDITGKALYEALRYYDIFVLYPLMLFFYYCYIILKGGEFRWYKDSQTPAQSKLATA